MSTVQRRRGKSLHLELPGGSSEERPPIVALFLIQFDVKAGYTIAWKQSVANLELADSVEFKSLPSGLHNVKEDLVYFMHDEENAGISAFVNKTTNRWERNALMLAVGALVPLDQGRLGRSWKHAENLKELAEELVNDPSQTKPLEDYWANNRLADEPAQSDSRPGSSQASTVDVNQGRRPKSMASGINIPLGLSPYHPALALPTLIESFGPLIFPLYKAALLRKRILLMHEAPVELACRFVYNISILSNIPSSLADLIPLEPLPSRLQPLFSVGVHDIDNLSLKKPIPSSPAPEYGWIACSTDDVLSSKTDIYDILITMPPSSSRKPTQKTWPRIRNSSSQDLKASQRDLRRYRTLRHSIARSFPRAVRSASPSSGRKPPDTSTTTTIIPDKNGISPTPAAVEDIPAPYADDDEDDENNERTAFLTDLASKANTHETFDDASSTRDEQLIEPLSWSALAYNSFMWWASAGEQRAGLEEEAERDAALFRDFNSGVYADTPGKARSSSIGGGGGRRASGGTMMTPGSIMGRGMGLMTDGTSGAAPEMTIIAYFHRLTGVILGTLAQVVEREEGGEEFEDQVGGRDGEGAGAEVAQGEDGKDEEESRPPVFVGSEDMVRMGLDVWSDADRRFVEELLDLYWGRKADVQGAHIECCGVRIL